MYYFTLPRIVLRQLFLTGKTVREIGKGILCIPTKWQALVFNHIVYGVKLLSIEMYEFAAPGMGRILFTLKTILEGSLLEIEFRLRLQHSCRPAITGSPFINLQQLPLDRSNS